MEKILRANGHRVLIGAAWVACALLGAQAALAQTTDDGPVIPDPVLSPDAVRPDPVLSPDAVRADPVLSPDAVRADPVLSPDAVTPDPVRSVD